MRSDACNSRCLESQLREPYCCSQTCSTSSYYNGVILVVDDRIGFAGEGARYGLARLACCAE